MANSKPNTQHTQIHAEPAQLISAGPDLWTITFSAMMQALGMDARAAGSPESRGYAIRRAFDTADQVVAEYEQRERAKTELAKQEVRKVEVANRRPDTTAKIANEAQDPSQL